MSEQQARKLAAMLTEKQKRDLVLLVHILTELKPVKEAGNL